MPEISNTVLDQRGHPVAGAEVAILDLGGALIDTLITDEDGEWSTEIPAETYFLIISKGDWIVSRRMVVCPEI